MKKTIKIIIIFVIFISVFYLLNKLLSVKYADDLIEGNMTPLYYESTYDHDVIFIGDCEVYANISPLEMYKEYGIKSYNRGNSQQLIWQSYYILKETLNYEKPAAVVLSISHLKSGRDSGKMNEAYNRLLIDKMKWSKEKVDIINASMTEEESFISYVLPILRYHSRFDELTSEDIKYMFKNKKNTFNGFLVNNNVRPLENLPTERKQHDYSFPEECIEYLDKIVELCKENNIELVLMKSPSIYPYWYEEYDKYINEYAKRNGLKYYNLLDNSEEMGLDMSTDTYDGGLHLNLNGAKKLSKYFGKVLQEDLNLKDYRNDKTWDKLLNEYEEYISSLN